MFVQFKPQNNREPADSFIHYLEQLTVHVTTTRLREELLGQAYGCLEKHTGKKTGSDIVLCLDQHIRV